MTYTSHWDANLSTLRNQNPGINFSKVLTHSAKVMGHVLINSQAPIPGAILGIEGVALQPDGTAQLASFPDQIDRVVVLSLVGACALEHPEYFDLKNNQQVKQGLVISYDYDTTLKVSAGARYNMYKLYQKIVSSGSSGGFFSSRSWSSVEETNYFRDVLSVEVEDPANKLTAAEKENLTTALRRNILMRLAVLALPQTPNQAELINALPPPQRGAVIVASSIQGVCPTNIYCQGASAVFRILDAIFGSSSSSSSYTNIQNIEVVEKYSDTQKLTQSGITSYQ